MDYLDGLNDVLNIVRQFPDDDNIDDVLLLEINDSLNNLNIKNGIVGYDLSNLIKKYIKNNYIRKEDKLKIIRYIKAYIKRIKNSSSLINLVNNIIEKKLVTSEDKRKLREILDDKFIGTEFYTKFVYFINNYLKEGVIEDNEILNLKTKFYYIFNGYNIDDRLKTIKKLINKNEIIGQELIKLIDDQDNIEYINNLAETELKNLIFRNKNIYDVDYQMIYISLILIGLLNYDGNYYEHVAKTYRKLYASSVNKVVIENKIRQLITKVDDKYVGDNRQTTELLKNAIVPKYYLPAFLDFIFDIYKYNFQYELPSDSEDIKNELSFVYESIRDNLSLNDDNVSLKSVAKTYNLIKSTKYLINDLENINYLLDFSEIILRIIDNYYWQNKIENYDNSYFNYGFQNWKKADIKEKHKNNRKKCELHSRWQPQFVLESNKIFIRIPEHKIKEKYDYEKLKIEILNGNRIIYTKEVADVYEIIGGYRLPSVKLEITNPLENLEYRLLCDNEQIYSSGKILYRNYIMFDNEGKEIFNQHDHKGTVICCSKIIPEKFVFMFKNSYYSLGLLNVKIGDFIKINNEYFTFSTNWYSGIVGTNFEEICKIDDKAYEMYKYVENFVFQTINVPENIMVLINNKRYHLDNLSFNKTTNINTNYYLVNYDFPSGKNVIEILEKTEGKYKQMAKFSFILDPDFNYELEKLKDDEFKINIFYLNNLYQEIFDLNKDDINHIKINNELSLDIALNLEVYRYDKSSWKYFDKYLWLENLGFYSQLTTIGFEYDKVVLRDEHNNIITTLMPTRKQNYIETKIGSLKNYGKNKFLTLDFCYQNIVKKTLKCYCQIVIDKNNTRFWYDNNTNNFYGIVSYYGDKDLSLVVKNDKNEEICKSKVKNKTKFLIENTVSFKRYQIVLLESQKNSLFSEMKAVYSVGVKYIATKDFVNHYFSIVRACCYSVKGLKQERDLKNTYIEVTKQLDSHKFEGNLYVYNRKKIYLNKLNPVIMEVLNEEENSIIVTINNKKDEEALFYDPFSGTILNSLYDKNKILIDTYVIEIERSKK